MHAHAHHLPFDPCTYHMQANNPMDANCALGFGLSYIETWRKGQHTLCASSCEPGAALDPNASRVDVFEHRPGKGMFASALGRNVQVTSPQSLMGTGDVFMKPESGSITGKCTRCPDQAWETVVAQDEYIKKFYQTAFTPVNDSLACSAIVEHPVYMIMR
jgi:hypothetical protein